jgi:hypothetical protein
MQHKPGRAGRILAALFLAIAGPACAQILGNDYVVTDDEETTGGGTCSNLDCGGCSSCALATECSSQDEACFLYGCAPTDCCFSCGDSDCDVACECAGWQQRLGERETCLAAHCPGCGGVSVGVGGG